MTKSTPKATLIISIYKNIPFLKTILDSLTLQTEQNFEIIISEDGDDEKVKQFIEEYSFSHPYKHLSQPDNGWNKCAALNNAVLNANADWLIFIDGDSVIHPRFIEMHLRYARPDRIVHGKRVKLNDELSELLMSDVNNIPKIESTLIKMLLTGKKNRTLFVEEGIFINPRGPLGFIARARFSSKRRLIGSNMSLSKKALLEINGFDEDYKAPTTGEDKDIRWRLERLGYKAFSICMIAIQYHLNHPESWNLEIRDKNEKIMFDNMKDNIIYCKNGINKV